MTQEPPAAASEPPGPERCPRCEAPLAPDQDWCLRCGAAARTRLAPTPNWRLPVAALALVALLAGLGLAVAFVALTDDAATNPAQTTATAPVVAPAPSTPPPPTTPPAAATTPPTVTVKPPTTANPPVTTIPPATIRTAPPAKRP